ncbi:MAG TPA: hypothetical protein VGC41_28320, partial [Kofleriaceae bacterium]
GTGVRTAGMTGPQQPIPGPNPAPQASLGIGATGPQPRPLTNSAPPPLRDISGPNVAPPPSYSGAYPLYHRPPAAPDEKKGMPRALVVVLGAVTVGIVVGVVMALSGGTKHAVTRDAGVVVMTIQDAAIQPLVAPVVDAATPDAAPPDAAPAKPPEHQAPAEKLAEQLDQGDNAGAVATCLATPALLGAVPVSCAIAACRAHDARNAKKWYAGAGSKKSTVINACKAGGIQLEPSAQPPPDKTGPGEKKKDCSSSDPMACQH